MTRRRRPLWIAVVALAVTFAFLSLMFGMFWLLGTVPLLAFLAAATIYAVLSSSRKPRAHGTRVDPEDGPPSGGKP